MLLPSAVEVGDVTAEIDAEIVWLSALAANLRRKRRI